MQKIYSIILLLLLTACQTKQVIAPPVVREVEVEVIKEIIVEKEHLPIIGEAEKIYFLPMKSPFLARIDTGATTSSIDVDNVQYFERDGEKWISFELNNRKTKESHTFKKKIQRSFLVRRVDGYEPRKAINMDVEMNGEKFVAMFSIAERDDFEYQGLIGRNILTGRFIVDTSSAFLLD